ncbi:MAG TPA: MOSC domain-containing protein [Caulobacterales bacterium]|nr:MOSC domain-containing protein [Caulobacterales bacterium]
MPGTFFDYAPLHLLTDAALASLAARMPHSQIALERFRPNVLIASASREAFPENAWTGRTIRFGDEVAVKVTDPCPRCAMTTLQQADLPKDALILKGIAKANTVFSPVLESNQPCLGAYAFVVGAGVVRCGDPVWIDESAT